MSNSHSKKVILLVEDEVLIAMNEKMELEKRDYVVHHVTTGEKAVQAILDNVLPIDLILMDINLGSGIDGTQAAEEILKAKDIPVVFLSSHTEPEVVEKTEKITSYGYVVKNSGIIVLDTSIKMAFKLFNAKIAHKQKEEDLRKSEYKYRMLFENMNVSFGLHEAIYDDNGNPVDYRYLDMNPMFLNNLGCTASAIRGHTAKELFPNTEQYWIDTFGKVAKTGESVAFQNYSRELDQWFNTFIFSPQKNQFASFFIDITEQKRAEAQLKENEHRLRLGQQIAKLGDFRWDVTTGEVAWSDGLYELLGYDKSEKIDYAKVNKEIHHPADLERVTRWLNECLKSGDEKLSPNEYRLVRKDKKVIYVNTVGIIERTGDNHVKVFATIQDITEQKKSEFRFQKQIEEYELIFNNSMDGILFTSPDGRIFSANPAASRILETSEKELQKHGRKAVIDTTDPRLPKALEEREKNGMFQGELRFKKGTGEVFPVELNTRIFENPDGEVRSCIFFQDITERKKAEQALQESEEKYYSLFNQAVEGIYLHDLEGNIIDANNVACEQTGYSKSELLRLSVFDIHVTGKDTINMSKAETKRIWERLKVGERNSFELEHKRKDGNIFPVRLSTGAVRYGNGKIIMAIVEDITERKQAEEALKTSKKFFTGIVENIPTMVFMKEAKNLTFYLVNKAAEETIGMKREELIGKSDYDIFPKHEADFFREKDLEVINSGKDVVIQEEELAASDQIRYVYTKKVPIFDEEGNPQYLLGISEDITELKKALREKDFLMKEINHRVKNNLAMISSLINLKNSYLGSEVDLSDLDNRINAIRLVHEKLYQTEDISHINLQEYIHELNENVFSLSKGHVEIVEHIDAISLSTKTAIPVGLIINELATNAMKHGFTEEGAARFSIKLTEDKTKNQYILTISNTGKPFPKGVALDNPNTLGLQLLSALVSQLQGTIELQRDPHPVFTIRFPVDDVLAPI